MNPWSGAMCAVLSAIVILLLALVVFGLGVLPVGAESLMPDTFPPATAQVVNNQLILLPLPATEYTETLSIPAGNQVLRVLAKDLNNEPLPSQAMVFHVPDYSGEVILNTDVNFGSVLLPTPNGGDYSVWPILYGRAVYSKTVTIEDNQAIITFYCGEYAPAWNEMPLTFNTEGEQIFVQVHEAPGPVKIGLDGPEGFKYQWTDRFGLTSWPLSLPAGYYEQDIATPLGCRFVNQTVTLRDNRRMTDYYLDCQPAKVDASIYVPATVRVGETTGLMSVVTATQSVEVTVVPTSTIGTIAGPEGSVSLPRGMGNMIPLSFTSDVPGTAVVSITIKDATSGKLLANAEATFSVIRPSWRTYLPFVIQ